MIYQLKNLQSRAATAENKKAEVGAGGKANGGRKGSPCIWPFKKGEIITLLDTNGPGMIRHIWMTLPPGNVDHMRNVILRIYWDGQAHPSVEVPIGDFFGVAHGRQKVMQSDFVSMQSGKGLNCWIAMPFQKHARITIENDSTSDVAMLFYQIDFTLGDQLDADTGYFHAQFRRLNPVPMHEDYTLLDGVIGCGVYIGAVLGVRSRYRDCWWGEGEFKFYIDGDTQYPTICGTGAEDYMGSAWGLEEVITPFQGATLVDNEQGFYSIYRFHQRDPIYFQENLKITVQQIGYGSGEKAKNHFGDAFRKYQAAGSTPEADGCYFDLSDDYCSVAYWYQSLPSQAFPPLPNNEYRIRDLHLENNKGPQRTDV